jgi:hypothetical protein
MATDAPKHFKNWYDKNKELLSEKRKKMYREDPEYREKVKARRSKQLANSPTRLDPLDEKYTTTFSEAAEELEITIWKFRHWRSHNYFPEPKQHGKFLYFTDAQMALLHTLKDFLEPYTRLPGSQKAALENLVSLIYANWN